MEDAARAGRVLRGAVPPRALRTGAVADDFLGASPLRALGAPPPPPLRPANFPLRPFN